MPADLAPGTQLALLGDVPARRPRTPPKPRRELPADVERVLVALAPSLPANAIPRFYPGCVEIPLVHRRNKALEQALRKAGFKAHDLPRHEDGMMNHKDGAWIYWRLTFSTDTEAASMDTQKTMEHV